MTFEKNSSGLRRGPPLGSCSVFWNVGKDLKTSCLNLKANYLQLDIVYLWKYFFLIYENIGYIKWSKWEFT